MQASSQVNRVGVEAPDTPRRRSRTRRVARFTYSALDVRTLLTLALPLLVGCILGQWLPTLLPEQLHLHVIWIPGPLLLGFLLVTPRNQWRTCVLAACIGTVLSLPLVPMASLPRLLASLGEFAMVGVVAWLLLRWRGERAALEDYRDLSFFLLLACVLLPLCSAWWYSLAQGGRSGASGPAALRELALTSAVSYLVLVPALVNVVRIIDARSAATAGAGIRWRWPWCCSACWWCCGRWTGRTA